MAKIDALSILQSLDKEDLAKQTGEAKEEVRLAVAKLRALQSLEKIRMIRAGEMKRKSPVSRKPKKGGGDGQKNDLPLTDRIKDWMRVNGPAKPAVVAASLGVDAAEVLGAIEAHPDVFQKTNVHGFLGYTLR